VPYKSLLGKEISIAGIVYKSSKNNIYSVDSFSNNKIVCLRTYDFNGNFIKEATYEKQRNSSLKFISQYNEKILLVTELSQIHLLKGNLGSEIIISLIDSLGQEEILGKFHGELENIAYKSNKLLLVIKKRNLIKEKKTSEDFCVLNFNLITKKTERTSCEFDLELYLEKYLFFMNDLLILFGNDYFANSNKCHYDSRSGKTHGLGILKLNQLGKITMHKALPCYLDNITNVFLDGKKLYYSIYHHEDEDSNRVCSINYYDFKTHTIVNVLNNFRISRLQSFSLIDGNIFLRGNRRYYKVDGVTKKIIFEKDHYYGIRKDNEEQIFFEDSKSMFYLKFTKNTKNIKIVKIDIKTGELIN
jgi:hypothetical protein